MRKTQFSETVTDQVADFKRFVIFKRKHPLNGEIIDCRHITTGSKRKEVIKKILSPQTPEEIEWIIDATNFTIDQVSRCIEGFKKGGDSCLVLQ